MDRERFISLATAAWESNDWNLVPEEYAFREDLKGMPMFEDPIYGVSDARDPLFLHMKNPGVIGPHYLTPEEWLPGARSVISFFLPFTAQVRESNRRYGGWPSSEWQHARVEGELAIATWKRRICEILRDAGYEAMIPADDSRFFVQEPVSSNWSERHAAFISGLGTFGLSRGLITKKGMAGRFGSVITTAAFEADDRPYQEVYEYCSRCGACARRCPAGAIRTDTDPDFAKDQETCGNYLQPLKDSSARGEDTRPREDRESGYQPVRLREHYGCGKCQVGVPCETGIPPKRKNEQ